MISNKSYLFALSMGILVVVLTYVEARHHDRRVPRSTYIKHFIVATSISLATVYYGCDASTGATASMSGGGAGGGDGGGGGGRGGMRSFDQVSKVFQPEIMTGNPDF